MAAGRSLKRVLEIRSLEADQARMALEMANARLEELGRMRLSALNRASNGRDLVKASAMTGDLSKRLSGLVESESACRGISWLEEAIRVTSDDVERIRSQCAEKSVEVRRLQTVIESLRSRERVEENRKAQQSVDSWYLSRNSSAAFRDANSPVCTEAGRGDNRSRSVPVQVETSTQDAASTDAFDN